MTEIDIIISSCWLSLARLSYGIDNSGSGRVHAAGNDYVTINTSLSKRVVLSPLKNVRVRNGEWVDADTIVGEATGNLKVEVIERRTFWPNRHIYPSAYIFDLEFPNILLR